MAIDHRLDDLTDEQFQTEDQTRSPDRQRPARVYRRGNQDRQCCADKGADIGNEAQNPRQGAPKDGIGHAYDREPEPDHDFKGGVHRRLGQEIFAQAIGSVIDRRGRSLEVVRSSEPNQTVA